MVELLAVDELVELEEAVVVVEVVPLDDLPEFELVVVPEPVFGVDELADAAELVDAEELAAADDVPPKSTPLITAFGLPVFVTVTLTWPVIFQIA